MWPGNCFIPRRMNYRFALLLILPALLCANPATGASASTFHVKYEGGTLPLGQGKMHVTIAADKVVFTQGRHALAIPLQNITMISCNTDVRRRFGAYVGLTWTSNRRDSEPASRIEGVFKLSSSDYDDFLSTLERLTGRKAVDTHRVPTVVRYGI